LPTELEEMAIIDEFDENDRFITTCCDPSVGHNVRIRFTFHHKKGPKDGF
jgi:predicted RNA polymerase sigma factor